MWWAQGEGEQTLKYSLGFDSAVTDDSLWEFTQDFVEGEQPLFVWSEPEPSKDEAAELAPLVKVVGSTFDKLVHDNATDVFTLVTHPRSKHCEMFMPTWKELATVSPNKPVLLSATFVLLFVLLSCYFRLGKVVWQRSEASMLSWGYAA